MGIFVLAQIELESNILHLQSKWLINSHRILFLLHTTLKKMDGFYYSTYYILSAKVKKMWFPPSLPSCKNKRGYVIIYCWKEMQLERIINHIILFGWHSFVYLFLMQRAGDLPSFVFYNLWYMWQERKKSINKSVFSLSGPKAK